jgi:hypothetical protein
MSQTRSGAREQIPRLLEAADLLVDCCNQFRGLRTHFL